MQMIKRPWLGSLSLTLSFSLLELGRWESYLKIELRRFTVSFHLPRSVAVSFLHVCLCVCGWESSRVCLTLPRSAQKCVYVCLFSLYHDLLWLHFRYFWSADKWWNATRRNSALGFIAESSRVESQQRRRWRWLQHSFAAYDVDVKFMCGVCFACEQRTPPEKVETFSRPSPVNC